MNKDRFIKAKNLIMSAGREQTGIGTLREKTLHAVLKYYFEPDLSKHEIKTCGFVADILNDENIIEVQTRDFNKLRAKLEAFLKQTPVTIVYPIIKLKWLCWIDNESGEITSRRKSPKAGTVYDIIDELYKIKSMLDDPNLHICMVFLEAEEYRNLNGWSRDKKKGSSRYERIPVDIYEEVYINSINDYSIFIPENLPLIFTSKDYAKAAKINKRKATTALNILYHVNALERTGKQGNMYLYRRVTEEP